MKLIKSIGGYRLDNNEGADIFKDEETGRFCIKHCKKNGEYTKNMKFFDSESDLYNYLNEFERVSVSTESFFENVLADIMHNTQTKKKKQKKKTLQVYMPEDICDKIERAAASEYMSVSQYVRSLLIQKVDEDFKMKNVDRCL